jgi:hypothetical protein
MHGPVLEITGGAAAGAWIQPGLEGEFGSVTRQVPRSYEAYARIFHPAYDRESKLIRWAEVAKVTGTTAHREMQWEALTAGSEWEDQVPSVGEMDLADLDGLCEVLAGHTSDPYHCYFGLCTIQGWEDSFLREELKPLLRLPLGRDYIVLAGPLSAVDQIARDWSQPSSSHAIFRAWLGDGPPPADLPEPDLEPRRDVPNLIWPADRSWFVVSEVDFDSTLVGGSAELIKAIVESPALEAWQVEPTDSLAFDADKINGASGAC